MVDYAVDRFHPRLVVACSFQKEASVVLDLILRAAPDARVFTLDTHVLFPETYETWKAVEARYGIEVVGTVIPSLSTQAQPSAGEIARLADTIRRERVHAIFPESSESPRFDATSSASRSAMRRSRAASASAVCEPAEAGGGGTGTTPRFVAS